MFVDRLNEIRNRIRALESVVVCYSGGVDSAFVMALAHEQLGERAVALTAVSASMPASELEDATRLAARLGAKHLTVASNEIADPGYVANGSNRCFHCKTELYTVAQREMTRLGFRTIANGVNVDDLGDHRPGLDAARSAGVLSPLVEMRFTKADVREGARALGLGVWDKPASACLASRIPYGTSVTTERLSMIGNAEHGIKALGLRQIRVRYHDKLARVEVAEPELTRAFELRGAISRICREAGFTFVSLDLDGYRMGSFNETLRLPVIQG